MSEPQKAYNKQRNFCLILVKKVKREYYSKLDIRNVIDNRKFWNTVKPFLSAKNKLQGKIAPVEKDETVSPMTKNFSEFFANAVPNLNIPELTGNFDQTVTVVSACPIINAIAKYENYLSVTKIRNKQVIFSFSLGEEKENEKILPNLSEKKACLKSDTVNYHG